jgi:hypothetical protein
MLVRTHGNESVTLAKKIRSDSWRLNLLDQTLLVGAIRVIAILSFTSCQSNQASSSLQPSSKSQPAAPPLQSKTGVPALAVPQLPTGSKIVIDGNLDEPAWQHAASTGDFVNVGTGGKTNGQSLSGRALLTWDRDLLYVAIVIGDTDIRGDFIPDAGDPHLWTESTAEIMIDPDGDGDNHDYYEIQIGPQNLVFDSQFDDYNQPRVTPNGPFGHQEWTARTRSAVSLRGTINQSNDRDDGYTVEAQIPWQSFAKAKNSPPHVGDEWRLNIYAMRNNGGLAWSPILGQGNFHRASRFGRVTWVESVNGTSR